MKIDRNVPLPTPSRGGRALLFPWDKMKPGDSFWAKRKSNDLFASAWAWRKRHKSKAVFTVRKEGAGTRAWRVK